MTDQCRILSASGLSVWNGVVSCRSKSEHNSSNSADCRPQSKNLLPEKIMSVVCRLHWVPIFYWWQFRGLQTSLSTITLLVTVSWIADFTEYHYFTGDSFMDCRLHWVPLLYWYSSVKLRISQCNLFRASRVYFQKLQTSYESLWTSTWLRRLTWLQRHRTSFLSLGTVYSNTENWQCEPENCSAAFSAWTFRDTLSNYSR